MSREESGGADSSAAALQLMRRALRYWRAALVVFLVGALGSAAAMLLTPQVFRSESVLYYRMGGRQAFGDVETSRRLGARLSDMLTSRDRLEAIEREFDIYPEFADGDSAVAEMLKNIGFKTREGATFVISFDARTPELAQKVTQRLAETLKEDDRKLRSVDYDATKKMLDEESARLGKEVQERQAALQAFVTKHPELAPPEAMAPVIDNSGAQLMELERQLAQLRAQRLELGLEASGTGGPSPEALAAVERAQERHNQEAKAFEEAKASYTEAHPAYGAARARLRDAEQALKQAKSAVAAASPGGGKSDPSAVERSIADLERRIERARTRPAAVAMPRRPPHLMALEVERRGLEEALKEVRDRLNDLENKRFQTSMVAGLESSDEAGPLSVLSAAYLPALPLTNAKKKVVILGLAGALLLALGVALLRATTDDRIFDRADILQMTSRQVLVAVPRAREGRARV